MMTSLFDRIENIVGRGENAGYQHFLLFHQCFLLSFSKNVFRHKTTLVSNEIPAITNFLVSYTCEIRFHDVIGQSTVPMYSSAKILKHG